MRLADAVIQMRRGSHHCKACGEFCWDVDCSNRCKMREAQVECQHCGGPAWRRHREGPYSCVHCSNRAKRQRYGPEDIVVAMVRWHEQYGQLPVQNDWAPAREFATPAQRERYEAGDWPSTSTVQRLVGWGEAKRQAQTRLE